MCAFSHDVSHTTVARTRGLINTAHISVPTSCHQRHGTSRT